MFCLFLSGRFTQILLYVTMLTEKLVSSFENKLKLGVMAWDHLDDLELLEGVEDFDEDREDLSLIFWKEKRSYHWNRFLFNFLSRYQV